MTEPATITPHRLARMIGRDPNQRGRQATPLELLFDLAFAASFVEASTAAAPLVANGHVAAGVSGFVFAVLSICLAWINFTWFASGFDTDDWLFRLITMVQIAGAVIFALGIPAIFEPLTRGGPPDITTVVAGYVVMRVAMVAQWVRAARADATHRRSATTYAVGIVIAEVGWVLLAVLRPQSVVVFTITVVILYLAEIAGPVIAGRMRGGTPWQAHHIAERYGLLFIITLGEGISSTIVAVGAVVGKVGWDAEAILLVIAGVGLSLAIWWSYFIVPFAAFLNRHKLRKWSFGYGHVLIFGAVAAMGLGFRVAASLAQGTATIGVAGAVLSMAIPVLVFTISYFGIYALLVRRLDPFHLMLLAISVVILAIAVGLGFAGVELGWCLIVIVAAPFVTVIGYETIGHRHIAVDVRAP